MSTKNEAEMIEAINVLTDAVRRERIPGVVEFRQLEDALKEIAADPSKSRWATADAAFNALDPDLRQRVADRAQQLAHKEAKTKRGGDAAKAGAKSAPPADEPPNKTAAKPAPKASASPFLNALNRGRLGAR